MPSAYRFTHEAVERIVQEWIEVIDRDYSHPCIAVWVPFNESWGVPDLQEKAAHQHCVQALYHITKTLDPSRPVVGNDGWESTATDIIGIHDYDHEPSRIHARYATELSIGELLGRQRPAGRLLTLEAHPHEGQPVMLTEFGGIAYSEKRNRSEKKWGYSVAESKKDLQNRYESLMTAVHQLDIFSGFCYTQLTDTFQEANGLLFEDRTPKIPLADIAAATRGTQFEGLSLPAVPNAELDV